MICGKCGKKLNIEDNFCSNCGATITTYKSNNEDKKKKNTFKIVLISILIFFAVVLSIVIIVSAVSKKYICKSSRGNITLLYRNNKLVGYTTNGINYNLEEGKERVKKIGLEDYFKEFNIWFIQTTIDGTCKYN